MLLGLSSRRFPYMRCRGCDLIFLAERPAPASMALFYPEHYHPYSEPILPGSVQNRRVSFVERFLQMIECGRVERLRERLQESVAARFPDPVVPALQSFYRPPKRGAVLLDFGCGSTWFLNRQRNIRWQTIGMEFKEDLVEQIRRDGHQGVLVSETGWNAIVDESVDAVRMNHVLEHLHDPKAILSRLLAKLKPGGGIHLAVPNPRGLSAHLFRSSWFSLEAPRHLMLYSPRGLARLLSGLGLVDIRVLHETTSKDFARSLGYVLREWRLLSSEVAPRMGDEPLLNAWLSPLMLWTGAHGYGDRLHAFARKARSPLGPGQAVVSGTQGTPERALYLR